MVKGDVGTCLKISKFSTGVGPVTANLTQGSYRVDGEAWTDHLGVPAVVLMVILVQRGFAWFSSFR